MNDYKPASDQAINPEPSNKEKGVKQWSKKKKIIASIIGVVLVLWLVSLCQPQDGTKGPVKTETSTSSTETSSTPAESTSSETTTEETTPETESEAPAATPQENSGSGAGEPRERRNAVRAAQHYLSVMPFSQQGLSEQLVFEGYSQEDADYAAATVDADWNEQAVKKARDYDKVMPMSDAELVNQLIFDGFTQEQAQYGVDNM